jgi:hypothetical protein
MSIFASSIKLKEKKLINYLNPIQIPKKPLLFFFFLKKFKELDMGIFANSIKLKEKKIDKLVYVVFTVLQIVLCFIKMNSEVPEVRQKNNLLPAIIFLH